MVNALQFITMLSAALFAGAALYVNLAEHPARMELETSIAAKQWAPSYKRATWMQAPLALLGFIAGGGAWLSGGSVGWMLAASQNRPTHAAKMLPSRRWTSKLGDWEDIDHKTLHGLSGSHPAYGDPKQALRRPKASKPAATKPAPMASKPAATKPPANKPPASKPGEDTPD